MISCRFTGNFQEFRMKYLFRILSFIAFLGTLYWIYREQSQTEPYIAALAAFAAFIGSLIGERMKEENQDVIVSLIKAGHLDHRMVIENRGNDSVFDVDLHLNLKGEQRNPFPQGIEESTFPIKEIYPGDFREILVGLTFGTGVEFDGKWTWTNRKGMKFERQNIISIKS